jgi:hypothetical protein
VLCIIGLIGCNDSSTPPPAVGATFTSFSINNTSVTPTGTTIVLNMPYGTNVNNLTPNFITSDSSASVSANGRPQTSGVSSNNFSSPVVYTVTGSNGVSTNYTVSVVVTGYSTKLFESFAIAGNSGIIDNANYTISVAMPFGTDLTKALTATYTTIPNPARVTVVGSTSESSQVSGTSTNIYSSPVTYKVYAADGTSESYTVTAYVASVTATAMNSFSINGVAGVFNGTNIVVSLPYGADISSPIAPTFSVAYGATVAVNGASQTSGSTTQTFSSSNVTPIQYVVTSADGKSTTTYYVSVTVAEATANTMTSYSLNVTNPLTGVITAVPGVITGNVITVVVPTGTSPTALTANWSTTANGGESVTIGGALQTNGITPNNFSTAGTIPLVYKVASQDRSQNALYYVYESVAAQNSAAITKFSLNGYPSIIEGNNIVVNVPYGTDVTALTASFTTSASNTGVTIGTTKQTSGTTVNNFTNTLVYTVTSASGSTAPYYVTVVPSAISDKAFRRFYLNGVQGTINGTTINVVLPYATYGSYMADLVASWVVKGSSVTAGAPAAAVSTYPVQTNGVTSNNFVTNPTMNFVVHAADGSSTTYSVVVQMASASTKQITAFSINGIPGVINQSTNTIVESLPFGMLLANSYTPSFTTSGESVAIGSVLQTSGVTSNSYASAQTYTVYDGNVATATYTVTTSVNPTLYGTNDIYINQAGTVAYMTSTANFIYACNITGESLTSCVSVTGVTAPTGVATPYGITMNPSESLAYIMNSAGTVVACTVSGKTFGTCGLINGGVVIGGSSGPYRIRLNPTGAIAFISNVSNSTVVSCSVTESTIPTNVQFNGCGNAVVGTSGFSSPRSLIYNTTLATNPYLLVSNQGGTGGASACLVANGLLASCSSVGVIPNALSVIGMAFNPNNNILYLANYAGTAANVNIVTACNLAYNSTTNGMAASGCVNSGTPIPVSPLTVAMNPNGNGLFMTSTSGIATCYVNGLYVTNCKYTGYQ